MLEAIKKEKGDFNHHIVSMFIYAGSNGSFFQKFTRAEIWQNERRKYKLNVTAVDPITSDNVTLIGEFRVFGHQDKYFCSLNMINTRTDQIPNGGSLEFISVGSATNFTCETCKNTKCDCDQPILLPCKLNFSVHNSSTAK